VAFVFSQMPFEPPVAAALNGTIEAKTIVCVISGGNIDSDTLATILHGEIPIKEH